MQGGTGKPQCSEGEGAAHVRVSERVGGGELENRKVQRVRERLTGGGGGVRGDYRGI